MKNEAVFKNTSPYGLLIGMQEHAGVDFLVKVEDICEQCAKKAWLRPKE